MTRNNSFNFLEYLAEKTIVSADSQEDQERIPSLTDLSSETGISIASLREQLCVARALGLVEVRPRTGIRRRPYRFAPAVIESLNYAISCDRKYFDDFADLRRHVEAEYWKQAVGKLTEEDKEDLEKIVQQAWVKLQGDPIRVPHSEHRELHIVIFKRLDNPFVTGILEAYWEAYEKIGLSRYSDLSYLKDVWTYHNKIVSAICSGKVDESFQSMLDHMDLIEHRNNN